MCGMLIGPARQHHLRINLQLAKNDTFRILCWDSVVMSSCKQSRLRVRTWGPARGCSAAGDGGDGSGLRRRHGDLRLELVEGGGGGERLLDRRPQVGRDGPRVRAHHLRHQADTTVKKHARGEPVKSREPATV